MEIVYLEQHSPYRIYSYRVKKDYKRLIRYDCPAGIGRETEAEMMQTAKKIFRILQCRDFARIDFRLSPEGRLYFIEINPLPGLAPGYSDYPMLAELNNLDYVSLVRGILDSALARYGLVFCR
jgi:D-alanine-D-alanine ligase